MDENSKNNPIRILTNHIYEMVVKMIETEQQLEEEKKRADDWYQNWQRKDAQLRETEAKLAEVTGKYEKLKDKINGYIENQQKGATENGESK